MEVRFAAAADLSFVHDVQPVPVSKFQGHQLEDQKVHPAFSGHILCADFYGDVLSVDAGGPVSRLFAIRLSSSLAVARMAARDRGRDRRGEFGRSDRAGVLML